MHKNIWATLHDITVLIDSVVKFYSLHRDSNSIYFKNLEVETQPFFFFRLCFQAPLNVIVLLMNGKNA